MPAAAKIEKPNATVAAPASGEPLTNGKGKANSNGATNQVQDPQKIVATIIEKKVRNLEKRKVRLLEIKALENKGQNLEEEQKIAVKKLDGVCETIDNLKEIGKHVTDGLTEYSKSLKKQQKRESQEKQTERQQQDAERIKLWLNAQFVLARLQTAKNDLLQGSNGALKLEETQVDALEKLVDVLSPQSVDVIESSAEKVQLLLEGNKREFTTGVSYSVLKETLIKLVASGYFENVAPTTTAPAVVVAPTAAEISGDASADKEETIKIPVDSEPVSVVEPVKNVSNEKPQEQVESKKSPQQRVPHPAPVHNQQQQQPLCFMRDQIAENDLHKDPAVVAVAPSGFAYPPHQMGQGLPASSGAPIHSSNTISSHYPPHMFPTASLGPIPSQTFTNPSYTAIIPGANGYIPVSMPGQISHQMQQQQQHVPEANLAMRNVAAPNVSPIPPASEKTIDQQAAPSDNQFAVDATKEVPNQQQTSQEAVDGKPANGHLANGGEPGANANVTYKPRFPRGRGRGNPINQRGRGSRAYGGGTGAYFNGGAPNNANNANPINNGQQNGGQQFNNQNRPQPVHPRQNGGHPTRPYRGNAPRNPGTFQQTNNPQLPFPQVATVPAK